MMSVAKKSKFTDLVLRSGGSMFDSKYILNILKQSEVGDAMNAAIALGNDVRFKFVVEHMRQDAIWQYWMQRDLKIVYELTNGVLPDYMQHAIGPKWKVYYLWMRLTMGLMQWSAINGEWQDQLLVAYSPNSTLRYVRLNVLELTVGGDDLVKPETLLLDFREQFPRFVAMIDDMEESTLKKFFRWFRVTSPYYSDREGKVLVPGQAEQFLKSRFTFIPEMEPYINVLDALQYQLEHRGEYAKVAQERVYLPAVVSLLQNPPRLIEYTRIMLAGQIECNWCGSNLPEYKCASCDTNYCGDECAVRDSHIH